MPYWFPWVFVYRPSLSLTLSQSSLSLLCSAFVRTRCVGLFCSCQQEQHKHWLMYGALALAYDGASHDVSFGCASEFVSVCVGDFLLVLAFPYLIPISRSTLSSPLFRSCCVVSVWFLCVGRRPSGSTGILLIFDCGLDVCERWWTAA